MEALGLAEFDRQSEEFDALVAATPDIDHFCSSSDWIVPASTSLMPPRVPWLFKSEGAQVALMRCRHPQGWNYLEPLEAMWGLACPVVGPDAGQLARDLDQLLQRREADWDMVMLTGLPPESLFTAELARYLLRRYELLRGPATRRCVASLAGGLDGYLSRRSRGIRRSLRRALRTANSAGIEFIACDTTDPDQAKILYERVVAVEARSWKGRSGVGIESGRMYEFYRAMVPRLARRGGLKLMFARDLRRSADHDVAYVLGGIFASTYRGLQFSFDVDYQSYALGNLCQYHQIAELCEQQIAEYDLGTEMDYKRNWAEATRDSASLVVVKR